MLFNNKLKRKISNFVSEKMIPNSKASYVNYEKSIQDFFPIK